MWNCKNVAANISTLFQRGGGGRAASSSMRTHFGGMFRILLARDSHPLCNVLKIKRSSRKHFLIHFPPRHAKYTHSHTQYTAVHTHRRIDSAHTRTHARPLNSCSCTWAPPFSLPLSPLPAAHVAANGSGLARSCAATAAAAAECLRFSNCVNLFCFVFIFMAPEIMLISPFSV